MPTQRKTGCFQTFSSRLLPSFRLSPSFISHSEGATIPESGERALLAFGMQEGISNLRSTEQESIPRDAYAILI